MRKIFILIAVLMAALATAIPAYAANPPHRNIHGHPRSLTGMHLMIPHTNRVSPDRVKPKGKAGTLTQADDDNWAGYVASGDTWREVGGTFTVPSIAGSDCTTTSTSDLTMYVWAGLDGWNNNTVEQDGVAEWCPGGGYGPAYYMFYDSYPNTAVLGDAVSPGDTVSLQVYEDADTGNAQYTVDDTTTKTDWVTDAACDGTCSRNSAEVVAEGESGQTPVFADVSFTGITATDTSSNRAGVGPSSWWNSSEVIDNAGDTYSSDSCMWPSSPLSPSDGTNYTVTYYAQGVLGLCDAS